MVDWWLWSWIDNISNCEEYMLQLQTHCDLVNIWTGGYLKGLGIYCLSDSEKLYAKPKGPIFQRERIFGIRIFLVPGSGWFLNLRISVVALMLLPKLLWQPQCPRSIWFLYRMFLVSPIAIYQTKCHGGKPWKRYLKIAFYPLPCSQSYIIVQQYRTVRIRSGYCIGVQKVYRPVLCRRTTELLFLLNLLFAQITNPYHDEKIFCFCVCSHDSIAGRGSAVNRIES